MKITRLNTRFPRHHTMYEECQRILNRRYDSAQTEESEVPIEIQAVQKLLANNPPPNPCDLYHGLHFRINCQFQNKCSWFKRYKHTKKFFKWWGRNKKNNQPITKKESVNVLLASRGRKIRQTKFVHMNRIPVKLRSDTDSDLKRISNVEKKIGALKTEKNYREACGVSGSKLKIGDLINCDVSFRGKTGKLKAYIVQEFSLNLGGVLVTIFWLMGGIN